MGALIRLIFIPSPIRKHMAALKAHAHGRKDPLNGISPKIATKKSLESHLCPLCVLSPLYVVKIPGRTLLTLLTLLTRYGPTGALPYEAKSNRNKTTIYVPHFGSGMNATEEPFRYELNRCLAERCHTTKCDRSSSAVESEIGRAHV